MMASVFLMSSFATVELASDNPAAAGQWLSTGQEREL